MRDTIDRTLALLRQLGPTSTLSAKAAYWGEWRAVVAELEALRRSEAKAAASATAGDASIPAARPVEVDSASTAALLSWGGSVT